MSGTNLWAPVSFRISTCQAQPAEGRSSNQSRARMIASCEISRRLGSCLFYFMTILFYFYTCILDDYYVFTMYGVSLGVGFPSHIITISCTPWIPISVLLLGVTDTLGWLSYLMFMFYYFIFHRGEYTQRPWPGAWHGPNQSGRLFMYIFIYS